MFREVPKEEFKTLYFRLGGSRGGWTAEYWQESFEEEVKPDWRFMVEEPESPAHDSMFIVEDSGAKEYRLFFQTEEETESFFDYPGKDEDSTPSSFVNPPSMVIAAERLLSLSAVMPALITTAAYRGFLPVTVPGIAVVANVTIAALVALCAVNIGVGRNWARWLILVLFVVGVLILLLAVSIDPQVLQLAPTLLVVVGLIQCVIQLLALVLVFMPASTAWFKPAAQIVR
jgi:hypothetical protein